MVMPVLGYFFLFGISSSYPLPVYLYPILPVHYPNTTLTYLVLMDLFRCQNSDVFGMNFGIVNHVTILNVL